MNYFTAERLLRLQDHSNELNFLAALDEWERALQGYREHLLQVRGALPNELQHLIDTVSLHDAQVLAMSWGGVSQFTSILLPEAEPSRLVVLTYSLAAPPTVQPDVLPEAIRSEPVAWLYDELDFGPDSGAEELSFAHRILLSDGREIRLHFRNVTVKRPFPVVPARSTDGANPTSVRHSA